MNPLSLPTHSPLPAALPVFANTQGLSDSLAIVAIPFLFVVCAMTILYLKNYKTRQLQHDTIRLMLEKGQPVPPELFLPQPEAPKKRDDLRSGILWLAVAVGLFAFFHFATINSPDIRTLPHPFEPNYSPETLPPSYGPTTLISGTLNIICYRWVTCWIALVPGAVGIGLLLNAWLDRRKEKGDSPKNAAK